MIQDRGLVVKFNNSCSSRTRIKPLTYTSTQANLVGTTDIDLRMDTVQPPSFRYDPFERPAFTPYTPPTELLTELDHSGCYLLSQIHALDGRLNHLCTDWWSGIERDYRSKARMMGRGGDTWLEEMEQQEGKFGALHREFWTLEEDRAMMISSLEFTYGNMVSRDNSWYVHVPG
jgi:hypothetical protein